MHGWCLNELVDSSITKPSEGVNADRLQTNSAVLKAEWVIKKYPNKEAIWPKVHKTEVERSQWREVLSTP